MIAGQIDDDAQDRQSYRRLSYVLQVSEHPLRSDLPGVDQPEVAAALRAGDCRWLYRGGASAPI